jgi:hypothetical protein
LRPFAQATLGEFGYTRATAGGGMAAGSGTLLLAVDATLSNGPWVLDENLEKYNGLAKYSSGTEGDGFSVQVNGYRARWDSTDQIPERTARSPDVGRFGFIDDDVGGRTTRVGTVVNAAFDGFKLNAFATYYDLRLTSNFTYFLDDPVNGDEFQQADRRGIFGGSLTKSWNQSIGALPVALTIGGNLRYDMIDRVGLFRSVDAVPIRTIRSDQVDELAAAIFAEATLSLSDRLRVYLAGRGDYIGYDVRSDLAANSGDGSDSLFAPKAGLAWRPVDTVELYANYGESFHSNDVRGATITVDPANGLDVERVPVFARAKGAEIGGRIERGNFNASIVGFTLDLESELVFVGDAGATEPNDATRRYGVEANAFWKPLPWLTLDAAYAHTDAKYRGVDRGAREIPGAVAEVISGGISARPLAGLDLTMRLRHFGSAPLIEDGSVMSDPTTLVNFGAFYEWRRLRLGLELFNIFDSNDADITYFTARNWLRKPPRSMTGIFIRSSRGSFASRSGSGCRRYSAVTFCGSLANNGRVQFYPLGEMSQ